MQKKYRVLRFASGLYKIIAIIVILLAFVGAIGAALIWGGATVPVYDLSSNTIVMVPNHYAFISGPIAFIGTLLGGLFVAISLYALANLIDVLVATEENTRMTAILLNRVGRRLTARPRPAPAPTAVPPAK